MGAETDIMAKKATKREARRPSVLFEATERSLTGLTFGLLVAVVLVALSAIGVRPIQLLEAWGSDIGLQIMADPRLRVDNAYLTTPNPFVFLDIDYDACKSFVGPRRSAETCDDPTRPPNELLADLIEGLDQVGATTVIIDYRLPAGSDRNLPGEAASFDRLKEVLTAESGVPVIAPAVLAPVPKAASAVDRDTDRFIEGWAQGRLRLAAFLTWADPNIKDGVIRGYPSIVDVQRLDGETTFPYLPSAPFLAALIAENANGLEATSQVFYPHDGKRVCSGVQSGPTSVSGRFAPFMKSLCSGSIKVPDHLQLLKVQPFSIKSLSTHSAYQDDEALFDERLISLATAYRGAGTTEGEMLYRRFELSAFIDEEDRSIRRLFQDIELRDQIVVIGTSSIEANDWHKTSLGYLAGPEVIINATRAFAELTPLPEKKSVGLKLTHKIILTLIAALALFPFTFISIGAERLLFHLVPPKKWIRSGVILSWEFVIEPAIFLFGVAVAIWIVSIGIYWSIINGLEWASYDFLLPVLAVAFEGLVEISHGILKRIEGWIRWFIALFINRPNAK